jgi:hypothetical protein
MTENQQQWVVINRKTGTIYGSRVYLSEKTALSYMKGKYIDYSDLMPVELARVLLMALGRRDMIIYCNAKESIV